MADLQINAEVRTQLGGSTAKQLRAQGRVPGVIYGHGEPSKAFHVKELDLRDLIYTNETHVVRLKLNGEESRCILREVQFDPITDRVVHVDFLTLHAGEKITIDVPVALTGSSIGARDGGVIDHVLHKITLNVLPDAIPDKIEVNITDLKIGHSIHIKDLPQSDSFTYLGDENAVIVACAAPKVSDDTTAQTEAAEPEQIQAKGKKEEEG